MNLSVIRWLIAHRELLVQVVTAVKKFNPNGTYLSQWEVVDEVARIVLPALEKEGVLPLDLLSDEWGDDEYAAFAVGAEVSAMGIDWQQLITIVLPILIAILRSLSSND
jgi:antitoxin component of RelBE/YafQ-DinJ toxin-antitoxin module